MKSSITKRLSQATGRQTCAARRVLPRKVHDPYQGWTFVSESISWSETGIGKYYSNLPTRSFSSDTTIADATKKRKAPHSRVRKLVVEERKELPKPHNFEGKHADMALEEDITETAKKLRQEKHERMERKQELEDVEALEAHKREQRRDKNKGKDDFEKMTALKWNDIKEFNCLKMANRARSLIPGIAVSVATMSVGFSIADTLGTTLFNAAAGQSPISGVPVTIVLGSMLRNLILDRPTISNNILSIVVNNFGKPDTMNARYLTTEPGINFCTKPLLQMGIVCLGIKLSLLDMATLGITGVPIVACAIAAGIGFTQVMARFLGINQKLAMLTAAGTSICGVTAIMTLAPAIKAEQKDIGIACCSVVAFGTASMILHPYLAHYYLFPHGPETLIAGSKQALLRSQEVGMFLGLAIHDTGQVMGAALSYDHMFSDDVAMQMAMVTKLSRNLFLMGVIPGLTMQQKFAEGACKAAPVASTTSESTLASDAATASSTSSVGDSAKSGEMIHGDSGSVAEGKQEERKQSTKEFIKKCVPTFLFAFLGMSMVRTVGDYTARENGKAFGFMTPQKWKRRVTYIGNELGPSLLGTAAAGAGMGISLRMFKGSSFRPFLLGFSAACAVASTGVCAIKICSGFRKS